ncbi:rust resistance kinase Lr10-like, partial [Vigna umbellata]|uniref:rust resistance kinase Lr10-like n=1 Tax=Vigna umbellata TaxID=87088 RepID=UPI001F5F13A4
MSCPILQLDSEKDILDPEIVSCTKLSDVYSVQWYVQDYLKNTVVAEWTSPNCSSCEAQGSKCRYKNGTQSEVECFVCPTNGLPTSTIVLIAAEDTPTGGFGGFLLVLLLAKALFHVHDHYKMKGEDQARIEKFLEDYKAMKPTRFTYADIKRITNGFSESLGEGAHGAVFKGMLSRDILVAVKILNDAVGDGKDFINEVGTMGKIHH